jgi:hypothetical protein
MSDLREIEALAKATFAANFPGRIWSEQSAEFHNDYYVQADRLLPFVQAQVDAGQVGYKERIDHLTESLNAEIAKRKAAAYVPSSDEVAALLCEEHYDCGQCYRWQLAGIKLAVDEAVEAERERWIENGLYTLTLEKLLARCAHSIEHEKVRPLDGGIIKCDPNTCRKCHIESILSAAAVREGEKS